MLLLFLTIGPMIETLRLLHRQPPASFTLSSRPAPEITNILPFQCSWMKNNLSELQVEPRNKTWRSRRGREGQINSEEEEKGENRGRATYVQLLYFFLYPAKAVQDCRGSNPLSSWNSQIFLPRTCASFFGSGVIQLLLSSSMLAGKFAPHCTLPNDGSATPFWVFTSTAVVILAVATFFGSRWTSGLLECLSEYTPLLLGCYWYSDEQKERSDCFWLWLSKNLIIRLSF